MSEKTITAEEIEILRGATLISAPTISQLFAFIDQLTARAEAAEAEINRRDALEPVAWMYRRVIPGIGSGEWMFGNDQVFIKAALTDKTFESKPLFTAAPAPVVVLPRVIYVDSGDCAPDIEAMAAKDVLCALDAAGIKHNGRAAMLKGGAE